MAEINQELLDQLKAEAEAKKAKKEAKKALRKAKRQQLWEEHKLLLAGIGIGTALTVRKIVSEILDEKKAKKSDDAPAGNDGAYRDGYRDGWADYGSAMQVEYEQQPDPEATETTEE